MKPAVPIAFFTKHTSSATKGDLGLIDLTGESTSKAQAAQLANAYARAFVDQLNDQTSSERNENLTAVTKAINDAQNQVNALSQRISTPAISAKISGLKAQITALQAKQADLIGVASNRVSIIETASVPTTPSSPRPKRDAALALFAALLLGSGAALLWSLLAGR